MGIWIFASKIFQVKIKNVDASLTVNMTKILIFINVKIKSVFFTVHAILSVKNTTL